MSTYRVAHRPKERGSSLVEYSMLVALLSVVVMFAVRDVGLAIGRVGSGGEAAAAESEYDGKRSESGGIFDQVANAMGNGAEEQVKHEDKRR